MTEQSLCSVSLVINIKCLFFFLHSFDSHYRSIFVYRNIFLQQISKDYLKNSMKKKWNFHYLFKSVLSINLLRRAQRKRRKKKHANNIQSQRIFLSIYAIVIWHRSKRHTCSLISKTGASSFRVILVHRHAKLGLLHSRNIFVFHNNRFSNIPAELKTFF